MTTTSATADEERAILSLGDRLAPSIPAVFFVCLALFVPLVAQRHLLNGDGDLARHLRHGLYMLQHHAIIWRDPFSFTRPGQPFIPFEYGSQLIYALVYLASGLAGVTLFAGSLIGATYALLARFLLRRGVDPLLAMLTVAAAAILGSLHWLARPHLISWLAIIIFFGLVEAARRPPLWVYAVLFMVWANLHGGWLYGIAVLGLYFVGNVVEYYCFGRVDEDLAAAQHFALALAVSMSATLVTPMGLSLWSHLHATFSATYIVDHTGEFLSPTFHSLAGKMILAILVWPLAVLIASTRRMHSARLALVIAGVWWSLTAQRNLPLFGITGLAVVAMHLDSEWRRLPIAWLTRRREAFAAGATRANTTGWIVTCCGILALLAAGHGKIAGQRLIADEFDSREFPKAAVVRAREKHLDGRIFSNFRWAGYLLFAWPENRVFMDGGTDFYGAELMRDHDEITSLYPGWRGILDRWRIDAVLAESDSRLARELVRTPGWALWYCDSVAAIVRRDSSTSVGSADYAEQQLVKCAGPQYQEQ